MTPPQPPPLAVWLLARFLPDGDREAFLGDLEERFHTDVLPTHGPSAARRWYWRETLTAPLTLRRAAPAPRSGAPAGDHPVATFLTDLRYALRLLARQPGFTALVTLTLALGIGATTAIFSAVYPILFASLPYPQADRLVMLWERDLDGSASNFGFETFQDVAETNRSFASLAAMGDMQVVLTGRAEPERLEGQRVSVPYFRTLGIAPALGRDFTAAEDVRGAPRVTILSHALWRNRFGGDSSLVGHDITLGGNPYTVVGIMPAGFENVLDPRARLWVPLRYNRSLEWACRSCRHLRVVARLNPSVRPADAERELDVISRRLVADHPTDYPAAGMLVPTLHAQLTAGVQSSLLAVLGAVALVLLIACANVSNLLLARASRRQGEFMLRAALGAGHGQVIRQLLTESLVLAGLGGALGVAVAVAGVRALVALSPPQLPRLQAIAVNGPVLLFAVLVTAVVGLAFGLVPALHAARSDLHHGMQESSRRSTGGRRLTRALLVVSEVALALTLLVGSGLLLRSMGQLFAVSPGFDPRNVLTLQVETGGQQFATDTATWAFFDRALAAVRTLPGVEAAAYSSLLPLSGEYDSYGVHSESHPRTNPEEDPSAFRYAVSAGYLETMRVPLLRGRSITETDRRGQPAVVIVNATLARRVWPGEDPVGQRIRLGGMDGPWRTVIGVAGDVKHVSLSADQPNAVYVPETQWGWADGTMSFVLRTRAEPAGLAAAVRTAIWAIDKDQPIVRVATMDRLVAATAAQRRFILILFEAFGLVALVLAAAGIYGVLSGTVVERLREIGVRAALGASRADLLLLVLRQGLGLTSIGVLIGLGAAAALTRLIQTMLFGVSRVDLPTYAGVAGLLVLVAALACSIPAWRAARVDPMEVLRAE